MTWYQMVERDMRECALKWEDAKKREKGEKLLRESTGQAQRKREKHRKTNVVFVLLLKEERLFRRFQLIRHSNGSIHMITILFLPLYTVLYIIYIYIYIYIYIKQPFLTIVMTKCDQSISAIQSFSFTR